VKVDSEFLECMLVQTLSQSIECIRNLVSNDPRSHHLVHEIVTTVRSVTNEKGSEFLHFEVLDSGLRYTSLVNDAGWSFQNRICQRCLEKMNGFVKRNEFEHHIFHNMVSFAMPHGKNLTTDSGGSDVDSTFPPPLLDLNQHGDLMTGYGQCGDRYREMLSDHMQWHSLLGGGGDTRSGVSSRAKPQRSIGSFSRNIMLVLQKQVRSFLLRMQRLCFWTC
jgi:hypothetical protein